ncbi:PIR protein [Plasmodium ovale]|uniref:PIR protein n=1 Tax=Plasmodium ovale TaxID=36330 RepID=A0A1D3JC93_PLAOA|nr:PIR protein [Plasmodium ovale]SBT83256.1 PIR protein [Plasmodium ovale]SBT84689.1 PIR protein [Plasmodium ovale]
MGSEDDNNLNLPSEKFYHELDDTYVIAGEDERCESLGKHSGKYTKAALLCMGLNGNLKNYDKLNIPQKMINYKCNYLSLWAHDRLSKLNKTEKATIMSTLLGIWGKSTNFKKCNSSDLPAYVDDTDYVKEKSLYDYALNYEELENRCKTSDVIPCTRKLTEYIRINKELYNQVKRECEPGKKNYIQRSCTTLGNIETIYSNEELLNLKCKRIEDDLRSSREQDVGGRGLQADFTETSLSGLPAQEVASSDSQKAIGTAVPILGVLSIGFILHKFTGLGSMARNLLRGRINGINSHDELTNKLLESTYDDQAHADITETYIGYQAT